MFTSLLQGLWRSSPPKRAPRHRVLLMLEPLESRRVLSQIDGYKWNDLNGDGVWDTREPALGGVTMQLFRGDTLVDTTVTMSADQDPVNAGGYWFTDVPAGTYTIREVPLPGWVQTFPADGGGWTFTIGDNDFVGSHYGVAEQFNFGNTPTCYSCSSIRSNFNGTPIAPGNYIWFNSVLNVHGLGSEPVTITFYNSRIESSAFSSDVPNVFITLSPTATTATTRFDDGTNAWYTIAPSFGLAGDTFLAGLSLPVESALPGGIDPVTWSGCFSSTVPGITINWRWAAAVYTQFDTDYNNLGVKPVDDEHASEYHNSDHAGTPENFKPFVIGGARGGGGSNFTGSPSSTDQVGACTSGGPNSPSHSGVDPSASRLLEGGRSGPSGALSSEGIRPTPSAAPWEEQALALVGGLRPDKRSDGRDGLFARYETLLGEDGAAEFSAATMS